MKHQKILITGKGGTVGSNLNFGFGFTSKVIDLRDKVAVDFLLSAKKPDAIIHLAAKVGGLKLHLNHHYELFYDNVAINTNIIDSAKKHGVKRVLSYLSSCIYSDSAKSPYTESMVHCGEPFAVHYPYGYAKRMLEVQSRICFEEFGLTYNCVIPTNIYGYHDNYNLENGHVVAVLIHKAYEAQKTGKPFVVWGDGKQKRDFIFACDIAELTDWALNNYFEKEPLIFSNSTPIEIGYIAELIADTFDIKSKLVFDTSGPSGQKVRSLDGTKLKELTQFRFTPIEEGISRSIAWFVENYPNVRL